MAKQKFCCKGVVRKTGQRVSAVVSADNKETAIKIANDHGVYVESLDIVRDSAPVVDEVDLMDRIDEIIKADDDDLGDEFDDFADDAPTPPLPSTKICQYCGERILAVALKCKHCGTYLDKKTRQKSDTSKWLWVFGGGAAVVFIVGLIVILLLLRDQSAPESPTMPPAPIVSEPSVPPTPAPQPTVEKPKPTADEIAYATKLAAFLDGVDETARLLEEVPKPDEYLKQSAALKKRFEAIPPPPGASWTEQTAASSRKILDLVNMLNYSLTTLDLAREALSLPSGEMPPGTREACHQAAEQMHRLVSTIRNLIPPECLAKP